MYINKDLTFRQCQVLQERRVAAGRSTSDQLRVSSLQGQQFAAAQDQYLDQVADGGSAAAEAYVAVGHSNGGLPDVMRVRKGRFPYPQL